LQVRELPPQRGDLDIPLGNGPRDRAQRIVSDLAVVAEESRRRPKQDDVGGGYDLGVERGDIRREPGQLSAAADGNDDDSTEDRGGGNE